MHVWMGMYVCVYVYMCTEVYEYVNNVYEYVNGVYVRMWMCVYV